MNIFKGLKAKVWIPVFAQIDLKKATVKIKDGSVTPKEIEVKIGEGNLTYTEARNIEYNLNRGSLTGGTVREGDEVPVAVSLDFVWEYIKGSGTTPSIEEAIKGIGIAETQGWISSDADACQPYAVDIEILYQPTPWNCGDQETITLADFRWESLDHDLSAGTISCSGNCNITQVTAVREAQTS